jgi:hypothetical protein
MMGADPTLVTPGAQICRNRDCGNSETLQAAASRKFQRVRGILWRQRNATINWKRRCQEDKREARFGISSDPGIPEGGAQNENKVRRDQLTNAAQRYVLLARYICRNVDISWLF